ncbi:MAG: 5'-nucleotidase, partial [Proteobacteria bacterium]|nr:5'-nucleotidase [Pseudomonadota bacterium]
MTILKVGISSRALFDMNESHKVFKEKGIEKYAKFQKKHEKNILEKGVAFPLVEKLLSMNSKKEKIVEVILLSRNSSDTGLRIFNSIEKY